jgi:glutamate N-acetyltransferase/amino-acid N-acetyltransferase
MIDFQDLDHIDGLSISAVCANLYKTSRDDLVMFYFREGANFASVYTKSKIVSENIKWNIDQKAKKIFHYWLTQEMLMLSLETRDTKVCKILLK